MLRHMRRDVILYLGHHGGVQGVQRVRMGSGGIRLPLRKHMAVDYERGLAIGVECARWRRPLIARPGKLGYAA